MFMHYLCLYLDYTMSSVVVLAYAGYCWLKVNHYQLHQNNVQPFVEHGRCTMHSYMCVILNVVDPPRD